MGQQSTISLLEGAVFVDMQSLSGRRIQNLTFLPCQKVVKLSQSGACQKIKFQNFFNHGEVIIVKK